ncbi:MAG: hypothetical protein RLY78_3012 [Pseudomonadota bacterium]
MRDRWRRRPAGQRSRGRAALGMTTQLTLLMLCGLAASHVIAVSVLYRRLGPVDTDAGRHVMAHLVSAYQLARHTPAPQLDVLLQAMSSPTTRFRITPAGSDPAHTPLPVRVPQLRRVLLDQLPEAGEQLRVRVEHGAGATAGLGRRSVWIHAAARLPDGRWLHGMLLTRANPAWWQDLLRWLPVSVVPVLLVLVLFLMRALRPVRHLAQAAEQVSRGERIAPLPLRGPREIREVSAAFNTLQERLTRFVDHRTRLLAAASHDVRTPITSLRLRAALVDDPALRQAMVRTLDHMQTLVEQVLRFARDDASVEPMREIDLRELMDDIAHDARLDGGAVTVEAGPARRCRVRPSSLRRALGNLVDNALDHGGGRVTLRLAEAPLRLEVDDEGPGLPEDRLESLFEPFRRAPPTTGGRTRQGTGLGLAIARSCARAHGGDVLLSNRPAGGLRATLLLP